LSALLWQKSGISVYTHKPVDPSKIVLRPFHFYIRKNKRATEGALILAYLFGIIQ
jgi:hypothetical protein